MSMPIIMLFVVMAICFIIRMPVSFSMLAASITYFLLAAPDKLGQVFTVITGNMFANYTMLAAPLLNLHRRSCQTWNFRPRLDSRHTLTNPSPR